MISSRRVSSPPMEVLKKKERQALQGYWRNSSTRYMFTLFSTKFSSVLEIHWLFKLDPLFKKYISIGKFFSNVPIQFYSLEFVRNDRNPEHVEVMAN